MKKNILAKKIAFYIILVLVWQAISMSDNMKLQKTWCILELTVVCFTELEQA
jgi:hypothetical protein